MEDIQKAIARPERKGVPTISALPGQGEILEMVYDKTQRETAFAWWREGSFEVVPEYIAAPNDRLIPYSPKNTLVVDGVVLFPEKPMEYGTTQELLSSIQNYISRYVDLSPEFLRATSAYVLFSWLYDQYHELPYLRVRGEPGTGKTRFLLTVGSICYKPLFASGASTVSPIFRMLDAFRGTLVIDESDFRASDEKADVTKILNNGNVRGFPVLRSEVSQGTKEINPRAYHVFSPKLVGTRGFFEDRALESRFISEEMGGRSLRRDIPINLNHDQQAEALELRNKLLLYRFRNLFAPRPLDGLRDPSIEPRLNQIVMPLLSVVEDHEVIQDIRSLAKSANRQMQDNRRHDLEAELVLIIIELWKTNRRPPAMKEITARLIEEVTGATVNPRTVGHLVRNRLGLSTVKTNGNYTIAPGNKSRLLELASRYGITTATTSSDVPEVLKSLQEGGSTTDA